MHMNKAERARINAQGFTFLARGPQAWGEGETEAKALSRCKTMVHTTRDTYKVETFRCSTNAFVNDMGSVVCDPKHEPIPARDFIEPISVRDVTRKR